MATIIDALLVTLGLDTSGFEKGQKDAANAQKGMRADATNTAKTFEAQGKKMADSIGQIRNQVIGLFAAFTAGRGLAEFVSDLTRGDAALGRTAKNIGVSTDQLSAWQGVAERAGGSAEGITGSMQGLSQQFQQLALTGQSSVVPYFRAVGVAIADSSGKMRPMNDILLDLSDRLSKLDPAKAQAIGRGLGIDEGTINVLIQGRGAISALLAEQEKLGHANEIDAANAQKRQAAFRGLAQASEDLGRKLLTAVTPAILAVTEALTRFSEWTAQHRPLVEAAFAGITAAIVTFSAILAAPIAGLAALSLAIAAAISGIALLYDDWKVWTTGGQSAFAGFWQYFADKWASLSGLVQPVIEAIKTYWSDLWATVKDGLKAVHALFFGTSQEIRATWAQLFHDIGADVLAWIDVIKKLGPLLLGAFKEAFSAAFDWLDDRFKAVKGAITGVFKKTVASDGSIKWGDGAGSAPSVLPKAAPQVSGSGAQADIAKFVALGWTKDQAAGIVANIQAESGGNASAVGDNGNAYGLGQWHQPRQDAFKKWAGVDIRNSTRDQQLAFVNYELREGSERAAGYKLSQATDAASAGDIVSRNYERPAAVDEAASNRAALAAQLANSAGRGAALAANVSTTNVGGASNSSSSNVQIGAINVNAPNATNSRDIAQTIGPAVQQYSWVGQANFGLTG